eukprot:341949-Chlamydomonas_euryale.AAC.1
MVEEAAEREHDGGGGLGSGGGGWLSTGARDTTAERTVMCTAAMLAAVRATGEEEGRASTRAAVVVWGRVSPPSSACTGWLPQRRAHTSHGYRSGACTRLVVVVLRVKGRPYRTYAYGHVRTGSHLPRVCAPPIASALQSISRVRALCRRRTRRGSRLRVASEGRV